jgi:hypothetical protein
VKLRKATVGFIVSVFPSVRPSLHSPFHPRANSSAPTGRIFMKVYFRVFFENLSRKVKFHQNLVIITGKLHESVCIFLIPRSVLLKVRDTEVVEEIKTHILCSVTFFRIFCRLCDNVEKYCRARQATGDNTLRRARILCWITKPKNTQNM